MGIMTGQAITAGHRRVDVAFCEIGPVMTLKTKFGYRSRERQLAFLLRMGCCVAGRAALFHARIPAEHGVDDPLRRHFLVTVNAGLLFSTGISCKAEEQGGEENDNRHGPQNHATY